jgi:hypothetical protein
MALHSLGNVPLNILTFRLLQVGRAHTSEGEIYACRIRAGGQLMPPSPAAHTKAQDKRVYNCDALQHVYTENSYVSLMLCLCQSYANQYGLNSKSY